MTLTWISLPLPAFFAHFGASALPALPLYSNHLTRTHILSLQMTCTEPSALMFPPKPSMLRD
jgi:hypothetical protein